MIPEKMPRSVVHNAAEKTLQSFGRSFKERRFALPNMQPHMVSHGGPIENVPRSTFGDGNASFAANHEHCSQTSNFKQVQVQHPFPDTATWVFLLWPSMPRTPKKKVRFSKGSFEFVVYIGLGAGLGSRAYNSCKDCSWDLDARCKVWHSKSMLTMGLASV